MSEAMVLCPKEKKKVPIWYCTGSFVQHRVICSDLIEAMVYKGGKRAKVKCKLKSAEKEN